MIVTTVGTQSNNDNNNNCRRPGEQVVKYCGDAAGALSLLVSYK